MSTSIEAGIVAHWKVTYGFITPSDGGDDVFVHVAQIPDRRALSPGDRVGFSRAVDRQGRTHAVDVTIDERTAAAQ